MQSGIARRVLDIAVTGGGDKRLNDGRVPVDSRIMKRSAAILGLHIRVRPHVQQPDCHLYNDVLMLIMRLGN